MYAQLREPPPSLTDVRPELPRELARVIETAMAKAKDERYPSCGALVSAARAALDPANRPSAAAPTAPVAAASVGVAEPDPALRAMIRGTFARSGYQVREATDASAALALVADEVPDLLVVASALAPTVVSAARDRRSDVRVVAVGDRQARPEAAGADAAVTKPFSGLQLLMTAEELLDDADRVAAGGTRAIGPKRSEA